VHLIGDSVVVGTAEALVDQADKNDLARWVVDETADFF
jgi:hypothetical protein